jgi:hypothetical protein
MYVKPISQMPESCFLRGRSMCDILLRREKTQKTLDFYSIGRKIAQNAEITDPGTKTPDCGQNLQDCNRRKMLPEF